MQAWRQYQAFQLYERPRQNSRPGPPASNGHHMESRGLRSPKPDDYLFVEFYQNDPQNPHNWSTPYKAWVIAQLDFLTLGLIFASSCSAPASRGMMDEFGCGEITATAATALFLIGCGIGALPFAPLSELYGRLAVYSANLLFATVFEIACAVAPNAPSLLVFRFLAGVMSTAPLSNAGGTLLDMGDPLARTLTFTFFCANAFIGAIIAPIMGGFVTNNPSYGWRWMYWVTAIWNALGFLVAFMFMPETLGRAILQLKARRLRTLTGDNRWRTKNEGTRFLPVLKTAVTRPFNMLMVEPVLQFFCVYLAVVYIVLYGSFTAYPLIFEQHGFSQRRIGLAYIPVLVGFSSLMAISGLHYIRYKRLSRKSMVEPEERLLPLMAVNALLPVGLFWLSWTSASRYSVWAPVMSGFPLGLGILVIFQGSMMYMMDAYGPYAASAISTTTLVRYCVPGLVLLGYPQMYKTLGNAWATSLFAILAVILTPVPFVFYVYGRRIRARCTWTVKG